MGQDGTTTSVLEWSWVSGPGRCIVLEAGQQEAIWSCWAQGEPLATCTSQRPPLIITFHSNIVGMLHYAPGVRDRLTPADAARERETPAPALFTEKQDEGQKHIVRGFKKGLTAAMEEKKRAFGKENNESAC